MTAERTHTTKKTKSCCWCVYVIFLVALYWQYRMCHCWQLAKKKQNPNTNQMKRAKFCVGRWAIEISVLQMDYFYFYFSFACIVLIFVQVVCMCSCARKFRGIHTKKLRHPFGLNSISKHRTSIACVCECEWFWIKTSLFLLNNVPNFIVNRYGDTVAM